LDGDFASARQLKPAKKRRQITTTGIDNAEMAAQKHGYIDYAGRSGKRSVFRMAAQVLYPGQTLSQ
jgi:hypothetical protein